MKGSSLKVLLIDDDPAFPEIIRIMLAKYASFDFELVIARNIAEAIQRLGGDSIDVVLLDLVLPDSDGLDSYRRLQEIYPDHPLVVITGVDNEDWAIEAIKGGAQDYLLKDDLEGQALVRSLRYAVERRRVADALRDAQQFLNSIVENIPNMIFVKDAKDLRFVRFNRAGEELLGYSRRDLIGKNDYDFFPKEEADFFTEKDREVLRGRMVVDIPEETINTRYKGERILHTIKMPILDENGEPLYLLGISEDITERKKAEEARQAAEVKEREILERTDRMNTLGLLAAGIAHEINNPLQGMLSHLDRIRRALPADFPRLDSMDMIERAVETIAELIQQLLRLGNPERDHRGELAECGRAVEFVAQLTLAQLKRAGIALIVKNLKPASCLMSIPERELTQVLLNLIINARDAMPDGGVLTITTDCDEERVMIVVSDTGTGIPSEELSRIFTPFYTTKGTQGSGLGLSVAASLIQSCNGRIDVVSEPGRGTSFTMTIPRVNP